MKVFKYILFSKIFIFILVLESELSFAARDLNSAATSAVHLGTTVARSISLLGVLVGAIGYNIPGLAQFGQRTLAGGLIGTGLAFGGPALMDLFRSIFGA